MRSWADVVAVLDLETTGTDPRESRVVSAHVGLLDAHGEVLEGRDWLIDPGIDVPVDATAVHGITTERARGSGRPAGEAIAEIRDALRDHLARGVPVVVYNAPFDLGVLHHEALRHDLEPLEDPAPIVDPLVIDRAVDPAYPGKRTLAAAADRYGVPLVEPHAAGADAVAAGRLAQALARHRSDELGITARELHDRQRVWYAEQAAGWAEWLRVERGVESTESDAWPVDESGRGRHRGEPLRIAAAVIERDDGAVLFVRKRGTTALMQPGGKLEPGETGAAALVRELREELGLRVREDELVPLGRFAARAANEPGVIVDALVYDVPLGGEPVTAAEIEEAVWLGLEPSDRELAPLSGEILLPLIRRRRRRSRRRA